MKTAKMKRPRVVVITDLTWPLRRHYEIIKGVQEYAETHEDWDVEVSRHPLVQMESGAHFDGIVGRVDKETYRAAKKAGIPMVNTLGASPLRSKIPSVIADVYAYGHMATQHLINRGMPRLISLQLLGKSSLQLQTRAMIELAREHNIPYRICRLPQRIGDDSDSWRMTRDTLMTTMEGWDPPVGIMSNSDIAARALCSMMSELGWKVPEDLAIVGAGNEEVICTAIEPTLSSVDQNNIGIGYEAGRLMGRLLKGKPAPEQPIMIPPKEIIARSSSDVYLVRDEQVQKALRYIADHSHRPIGVKNVVAATDVCRQTLERRFKKELNSGIYNELHRLRIERAKRVLIENIDTPIKVLSEETGFSTLSNFFVAFKKQTGMSPAEYRTAHANPEKW